MYIYNKILVLIIILSSTRFADYCTIFRENLFISAHIYTYKLFPEDGAVIAETCRRKDDK